MLVLASVPGADHILRDGGVNFVHHVSPILLLS